jgi:hypothetical protein
MGLFGKKEGGLKILDQSFIDRFIHYINAKSYDIS